jgi:Cu-Zn family superoxide dismutase
VQQPVTDAVAVMTPTAGSKVTGTVHFIDRGDGLGVVANLTGLGKGAHAFHVHVFGDCSAPDGESAGGHFKLDSQDGAKGGDMMVIGNLGELTPKADGSVVFVTTVAGASLQGAHSILGRAVVVHEMGNDMTKADGAAGKRLACGVIGIAPTP